MCKANQLYLFVDGARLASALTSERNDITLSELSALVDVLYIGGTKNGGLIGEAVVINHPDFIADFPYHLKQRGALLGKGRVFGVQFREFFKESLYFELAIHANKMAQKLVQGISKQGFAFLFFPDRWELFLMLTLCFAIHPASPKDKPETAA